MMSVSHCCSFRLKRLVAGRRALLKCLARSVNSCRRIVYPSREFMAAERVDSMASRRLKVRGTILARSSGVSSGPNSSNVNEPL